MEWNEYIKLLCLEFLFSILILFIYFSFFFLLSVSLLTTIQLYPWRHIEVLEDLTSCCAVMFNFSDIKTYISFIKADLLYYTIMDLRSGAHARHLVGFSYVPIQAPTRATLFTVIPRYRPISVAVTTRMGIQRTYFRIRPRVPKGGGGDLSCAWINIVYAISCVTRSCLCASPQFYKSKVNGHVPRC